MRKSVSVEALEFQKDGLDDMIDLGERVGSAVGREEQPKKPRKPRPRDLRMEKMTLKERCLEAWRSCPWQGEHHRRKENGNP